jgi:hypothetical protein
MVALTPRCAIDLGYAVSEEDRGKAYLEVSGRKGFGVKADDLLDKLIAAAQAQVDARNPDVQHEERVTISKQIAVGALRYFMLRFTRNTVIAFDFKDALSFEGETGRMCSMRLCGRRISCGRVRRLRVRRWRLSRSWSLRHSMTTCGRRGLPARS